MKFTIREAVISDCEALSALAHELNLFHAFDIKPAVKSLENDWQKMNIYVAENTNGELVGFLQGYDTYQLHNATSGYEIQNLHVSQKVRRLGVGKQLLYSAIADKLKKNVRVFNLTILKGNNSAYEFYKKMGFDFKDGNFLYFAKLTADNLDKFITSNANAS